MFTAPRLQNNETQKLQQQEKKRETVCVCEYTDSLSKIKCNDLLCLHINSGKTPTFQPLDFLFWAVADESRAGIMQLQHSHLQIQG